MQKTSDLQLIIERGEDESLVDFIERMGEKIFCLTTEEQREVKKRQASYARWAQAHAARHHRKLHARPPTAKANPKAKRPVSA